MLHKIDNIGLHSINPDLQIVKKDKWNPMSLEKENIFKLAHELN